MDGKANRLQIAPNCFNIPLDSLSDLGEPALRGNAVVLIQSIINLFLSKCSAECEYEDVFRKEAE